MDRMNYRFRIKLDKVAQQQDLTLVQIARRAGLRKNTVHYLARTHGDKSPMLHQLGRIAAALHLQINDLIELVPDLEEEENPNEHQRSRKRP